MIDPSEPRPILFRRDDQPELPDILQSEIEQERKREEERKRENQRWLEHHCGFRPLGGEW